MEPVQRELLLEFERLHEEWRVAVAAAQAIEGAAPGWERQEEVQRLLECRLAADRLHQQAMQLLRDAPL